MTQAAGPGHSFPIRPAALKPGEHQIVARRLYEVFASAPKAKQEKLLKPATMNVTGAWDEMARTASRHDGCKPSSE